MSSEREAIAKWMIAHGFSTGHGDSVEDLLKELSRDIRDNEDALKLICSLLNEAPEPGSIDALVLYKAWYEARTKVLETMRRWPFMERNADG